MTSAASKEFPELSPHHAPPDSHVFAEPDFSSLPIGASRRGRRRRMHTIIAASDVSTPSGQASDETHAVSAPSSVEAGDRPSGQTGHSGMAADARVTDTERIQELLDDVQPRIWVFTGDNLGFEVQQARRGWIEHFSDFIHERIGRHHDIILNSSAAESTIARLLQDIDWKILRFQPDVVLIMPSIRECGENGDRDEFCDTLLQVVERLHGEGCTVVLSTPPGPPGCDETLAKAFRTAVSRIRAVATRSGAVFSDNFSHWQAVMERDGPAARLHDGQGNPSPRGHRELTRRLLKALNVRTS